MNTGHVLLREPLVSMFGGARARLVEVVLGIDDDLTVRHATKLRLALGYTSDWSYGVTAVSGPELVKVLRAAEALVVEAERRS